MKNVKTIMILVVAGILIYACDNQAKKENEALKAEIALLAEENLALAEGVFEQELTIENYHAMLKKIDQQVAALDEKHELVKNKSVEYKNDAQVEEEILLQIKHVHHQMENAKHKIAHVQKNMNELRKENEADHEQLHQMDMYINDLATMVYERDMEIDALHSVVEEQGIDIALLAEAYGEQAMYSEVLLDIINTGFFIAGTKKELKEMGIIDMEGGFMGIGRVKTLNANASEEFLIPIDIRDTEIIEFEGKKGALITTHPIDSYEFTIDKDKELVFLGIANKLKFWQETNYLVIEIVN